LSPFAMSRLIRIPQMRAVRSMDMEVFGMGSRPAFIDAH